MLIQWSGFSARSRACAKKNLARIFVTLALGALLTATAAAQPAADLASDRVGSTAGEFRVDESGAATYSIPIYTPPGTAGVVPQVALSYSSQAGNGIAGRGWNLTGNSSISRCRASREHGDFIVNGQPVDGNPGPVSFTSSDKYCLDGQRLLPAPATAVACKALAGATVEQFRTEIESFQRVCAYTFTQANGPRFFTVDRKDGSTSWYGDRDSLAGTEIGNRPDGAIARNVRSTNGTWSDTTVVASWSQTRFQDSTGNYIDYLYTLNPSGNSASGEAVLSEIAYTGKVVLPGQTGSASAPYARILFNYTAAPQTISYQAGARFYTSQQLGSITVKNGATVVRHYSPTYATSPSGSGASTLTRIEECADESKSVCYPATAFDWTQAQNAFVTEELLASSPPWAGYFNGDFLGMKMGDVNGDGRPDIVYMHSDTNNNGYVMVAYGSSVGSTSHFNPSNPQAISGNLYGANRPGNDGWFLLDYDGDGRDDIFVSDGSSPVVYLGVGTVASSFNLSNPISTGISGNSDKNKQPKPADLNGDGLTDVIYYTTGGIKARLLEKIGASYAFGAERSVTPDVCEGQANCSYTVQGLYRKKGYQQLNDFNGDARSDVLLYVRVTAKCNSVALVDGADLSSPNPAPSGNTCKNIDMIFAMSVDTIATTSISLKRYAWWRKGNLDEDPNFWFADINGDGLGDFVHNDNGSLSYRWNNGAGFSTSKSAGTIASVNAKKYVQLADVNGDGRADIVHPDGQLLTFRVRLADSLGDFLPESDVPGGMAKTGVSTSGCDGCMQDYVHLFADADADGAADFIRLKVKSGMSTYLSRSSDTSRLVPRDTVTGITNGLGATTQLTYLSLNNKEVHDRYSNMRNWAFYGRGSPVQELVTSTYLVALSRSSAPTAADPLAKNALYYRYTGGAVQSGGRGFLGFAAITTTDASYGSNHVSMTTRYRQDFPYAGRPWATETRVVGSAYAPGACFTPMTLNCTTQPYYQAPALAGTVVETRGQAWELMPNRDPFVPGVQAPLQVQVGVADKYAYDQATSALIARDWSRFDYSASGNLTFTRASKYAGTAESTLVSVQDTSNVYADDEANWRLGRLVEGTVRHERPGNPEVFRTTSYDYDLTQGSAKTGLLKREQLQPGGNANQDLRTEYQLDEYGNRIAAFTCSQNITNCQDTSHVVDITASATTVHRYTRQEFDASGRYPIRKIETFRAPGAGWSTGVRSEVVTEEVLYRDKYGTPTQVRGLNGVLAAAATGTMGRSYWAWTQTREGLVTVGSALDGVASTKTYRYCGTATDQVPCPAGAVMREKIAADSSPTRWSYLDVLGRPVLTVAESFKAGVTGKDFAATCTWYDTTGKVHGVSTPFFLPTAAGSGEPAFSTQPCVLANRDVTYQLYDALGRPTQVIQPDGTTTAMAYSGLTTTTTVTAAGLANQVRTETRNVAGQLVSVSDNQGLSTQYGYDAAGNLTHVIRNAGRGDIVTTMAYDTLGRKIYLNDPDAGEHWYNYTPAGELEAESNGTVWHGKRYDYRGRLIWEVMTPIATPTADVRKFYIYDGATNGLGQLEVTAVEGTYTAWAGDTSKALAYSQAYTYDGLGRVKATTTDIDGVSYPTATTFDRYGRGYKTQDPTGAWAKTEYTPRGFAVRVCESSTGDASANCVSGSPDTYLETLEVDARGQVVQDIRGGTVAMTTTRQYDPLTGRMTELCAGGSCAIAHQTLGWDGIGNLQFRETEHYREEFTYDGLNRLLEARLAKVGGQTYVGTARPITAALSYDKLGNICSKTIDGSVHAYTYSGRAGCGLAGTPGAVDGNMTASPHQVRAIAGANLNLSFGYDAFGNQTTAGARNIAYSQEDRAYQLTSGSRFTHFWYGPNGERYKREEDYSIDYPGPGQGPASLTSGSGSLQSGGGEMMAMAETGESLSLSDGPVLVPASGFASHAAFVSASTAMGNLVMGNPLSPTQSQLSSEQMTMMADGPMMASAPMAMAAAASGGLVQRTITVANLEIVTANGNTYTRRYVAGVLLQEWTGTQITNKYLHHDHLGSVIAITNENGGVLERMDFGPFGERRSATDPRNAGFATATTMKGFTGHEMVDRLAVIHMNGRIYDDRLGRFLQADPIVQEPNNPQNFNRYTYVWNNPLAYTDPSGYKSIKQSLREFAGVLIAAYLPGSSAIFGNMANSAFASSVSGFIGGTVASGNVKGGLIGAFGVGVTSSVQTSLEQSYAGDDILTTQTGGKYFGGSETNSQQVASDNSETTEDAYNSIGPRAFWKSVPISNDGYESNADVNAAGIAINAVPSNGDYDVASTAEQRAFIKRIASRTYFAQSQINADSAKETEFFFLGRLDAEGRGIIVNPKRPAQGGSYVFPHGQQFSVHWHYLGQRRSPDKGDNSSVRKRGIPSFVITPDQKGECCGIWEVGRQNGDYMIRDISGATPSPWKPAEFPEWKNP